MPHRGSYDLLKVGDIALVEVLSRPKEGCQLCDEIGLRLGLTLAIDIDHELFGRHVKPPDQRREPVGVGAQLIAEAGKQRRAYTDLLR